MKGLSFSYPTETVFEGKVEVTVPKLAAFVEKPSDYAPSKAPVFYNPVMEQNRDLAVLALQAYQRLVGRDLTACEPLAGCGIRGVRLAKEVDGLKTMVINDINKAAFQLACYNVARNGLVGRVSLENEDANLLLSRFAAPRRRFDYVDVDPFGSPMPYVDSALRAVRRGGMLAVTATDLAPLCGVHPKACLRKYGGRPLRSEYCHELAIRLLAGAVARSAAKYDVGVEIMLSHSSEHYLRLLARVTYGARKADGALRMMGYVYHCFSCFHRDVLTTFYGAPIRECPECGGRMSVAGPLWTGKIVDEDFVESLQREAREKSHRQRRKINRLLFLLKEEANAPIAYYVVDRICDKLGIPVPSMERVIASLRSTGHKACQTHFKSRGIKTDASAETVRAAIWESMG